MSTSSRTTRRRRIAAVLTALTTIAACGGDDDAAWVTDPEAVRELKNETFQSGQAAWASGGGWYDGANQPCAFRPDMIAVYGDQQGIELTELDDSDRAGAHQDIEVMIYASEDPLGDSETLLGEGTLASPVYLMFPAPGRMFFPGTLPFPSDETPKVGGGVAEGTKVAVIDTGGWEGFGETASDDVDQSTSLINDPWTFGHGAFVGDIIQRTSGAAVQQYRVQQQGGNFDEALVDDAMQKVVDDGSFDVINLSLGTFPCYSEETGFMIPPVITLAAAANRLGPNHFLVAAAGNSGDDRLTVPAAFGADPTTWGTPWNSLPESVDDLDALIELIATGGPAILAVGAEDDPMHGKAYSTTGQWVTTERQGCQVGNHPGGTIRYPDAPEGYGGATSVKTDLTSVVYWCGTSFAAPVVSAEVACALATQASNEPDPRQAVIDSVMSGNACS